MGLRVQHAKPREHPSLFLGIASGVKREGLDFHRRSAPQGAGRPKRPGRLTLETCLLGLPSPPAAHTEAAQGEQGLVAGQSAGRDPISSL